MVLRKCIAALASDQTSIQKHIPYRECKLTSILKQSLGGNSYCLMIACISPSDINYEETVQTLSYALKTNSIKNIPIHNKDNEQIMLQSLRKQNQLLQNKLEKARLGIDIKNKPAMRAQQYEGEDDDEEQKRQIQDSLEVEEFPAASG